MSRSLQLPEQVLRAISRRAAHAYRTYTIPKKRGGLRTIHHPSRKLKMVQRWLLQAVIDRWQVHQAAYAYRPGRGIKQHASFHANGSFLLRMDVEDFFPSLRRHHLSAYLGGNPVGVDEWTEEDRDFFLEIVCRGEALTVGAPTSPSLSNALCFDLDSRLAALAMDAGARYSRYADDLFFSTELRDVLRGLATEVRRVVAGLPLPDGLVLNEEKTHHTSRKWRREVTGLIITPQGEVSLGRGRKRLIRGLIHRHEQLTDEERSRLRGFLAFARGIEPDLINRLVLKYGAGRVEAALDGE
ncbi:retron St85 family RNA-directed DNA polymerase [soil metagenome]